MAEFSDLFSYSIDPVKDTYVQGSHIVPRAGLLLLLTYKVTGEVKEFYMAGKKCPCPIEQHMRSMTDDLMLSWFKKSERKPKKVKNEAGSSAIKAGKQNQPATDLPSVLPGTLPTPAEDHTQEKKNRRMTPIPFTLMNTVLFSLAVIFIAELINKKWPRNY